MSKGPAIRNDRAGSSRVMYLAERPYVRRSFPEAHILMEEDIY